MFEENTINNLKLLVKASRMEGMKAELLFDPYGVKMFLKEKKGMKTSFHCSANKTKPSMVRLTINLETDMIVRLDQASLLLVVGSSTSARMNSWWFQML